MRLDRDTIEFCESLGGFADDEIDKRKAQAIIRSIQEGTTELVGGEKHQEALGDAFR